ncbi:hypothetical protein B7P43_G08828 [Cryptotermes secundus]|uniref:Spermatogenesis-associated protein 22 n=1 Tax=Cryptotermes secundus TaxID=105785 RepID=A0A2J7RJM3_9NEOP|nr:hypothetical protein B7P43_G08828 [Cryptotermes secundus]
MCPYQRPVSGGAIGQNMYNLFQGTSTMDSAIRFPPNITPSEQMLSRYNTPGHSKSRYGYPYFQDSPYYTEQHAYSYTPLVAREYSSFEDVDTGYRCQFEDMTSNKQNSYKQLKPTPDASLPKKSGHRVRFNLSTDKTKQSNDASPSTVKGTESPKAYKRWEDDSKPLRVLAGSIDKIIKWEKIKESSPVLFEVIATLVTVRPGGFRCEQMLLLRDEATPALQCLFYTIDRPLPPLEKGQLVRCVGELLSKNKLRAYSVRAASVAEKSGLQRLSFASQRAVTALQLAIPEP